MALVKWTEKYRPRSLDEILGNNKAVAELRSWAVSWEKGAPVTRAAILYGPAGTGKTSAAIALASELDWDMIEMNASDIRTATMIEKVTGPASRQATFSGRRRLIVLDEADNLHGTADRGGAAAMLRLTRETSQPVLLIANEYYEIDKQLRDAAKGIQFRSIRSPTVVSALGKICRAEGITCEPEAIAKIADLAGGDLRSAVNDLQAAALGEAELRTEDVATAERDVKSSIFKVLEVIFKGNNAREALESSYSLDESPEDLIHWIDENLPLAYEGEDLERGFEALSRSDVFLGRVRSRQNYGLWRYAGFLMTGGVSAAKSRRRSGYVAFRPPGLWRRMGQSRRARGIRDSAASKIGQRIHVSTKYARSELMDFTGLLLKSKKIAPRVAAELNLSPDEIALLTGSTASTKKVQSLFEEAQRIRKAEEIEDIELGWQRPAGREAGPEQRPEADKNLEPEADRMQGPKAHEKMGLEAHKKLEPEAYEKMGSEAHKKLGLKAHEKMGLDAAEKMEPEADRKPGLKAHKKHELRPKPRREPGPDRMAKGERRKDEKQRIDAEETDGVQPGPAGQAAKRQRSLFDF